MPRSAAAVFLREADLWDTNLASDSQPGRLMIYEVFARKTRGEALRHIGNVSAPDDELACVYAFSTYDEEKWFDMFVTPRDRLIEVFNRRDVIAAGAKEDA